MSGLGAVGSPAAGVHALAACPRRPHLWIMSKGRMAVQARSLMQQHRRPPPRGIHPRSGPTAHTPILAQRGQPQHMKCAGHAGRGGLTQRRAKARRGTSSDARVVTAARTDRSGCDDESGSRAPGREGGVQLGGADVSDTLRHDRRDRGDAADVVEAAGQRGAPQVP